MPRNPVFSYVSAKRPNEVGYPRGGIPGNLQIPWTRVAPTGEELFFWGGPHRGAPIADSRGAGTASGRPYGAVAVTQWLPVEG